MKAFRFPPQIAWPLALGGAFAVLAFCYLALSFAWWLSGAIAILVFVALYLIFDPRSEKEVSTDAYAEGARDRARQALEQVRGIAQQAQALPPGPVGPQILEVCNRVQLLLTEVQEKRPNELLSAAEAVEYRVGKLGETLTAYREILRDPYQVTQGRSAEITQRLARKTLPALNQWLNNNLDRLHAGDMMQLEVNMNQLEASQYEALK